MSKVVLVESIQIMRLRLEKLLHQFSGFQVEALTENILALKNVESLLNGADLLIIDYDSYEGDFDALMTKVSLHIKEQKLPVIILIAVADGGTIKKLSEFGAVDILIKPFEDNKFLEKVYKFNERPSFETTIQPSQQTVDDYESGKTLVAWNGDFVIGIEEIDQEHRGIIERFDKLYNLMRIGKGHDYYTELMDFLADYINVHFKHEEKLQNKIGYNKSEEHKALHEDFKRQVEKIIESHKESTITNKDLIQINFFIKDWLMHHIMIEDKKIGVFINAKKMG